MTLYPKDVLLHPVFALFEGVTLLTTNKVRFAMQKMTAYTVSVYLP